MSIVGLVAAIWAWNAIHPAVDLLVGFLGVGGLGWKILYAGLGALQQKFHPDGKLAPEFIAAWEALNGEMEFGQTHTYPPPGAFRAWAKEHKRTGVPAVAWLQGARAESADVGVGPPNFTGIDDLVEHTAVYAPTTFPDGSPFPGRDHAYRLLAIVRVVHQRDLVAKREFTNTICMLLVVLGELRLCTSTESPAHPTAMMVQDIGSARDMLFFNALYVEEEQMRMVLASLRRYWDQKGLPHGLRTD